jgi:hypothetical protein
MRVIPACGGLRLCVRNVVLSEAMEGLTHGTLPKHPFLDAHHEASSLTESISLSRSGEDHGLLRGTNRLFSV